MKKAELALLALTIGIGLGANGQGFFNLNFEQATVRVNDPMAGLLDWSLAVPGWSHSSGSDTSYVYYGSEHVGMSQYYLLMDSTSPVYAPGTQLAGAYSLAFASGHQTAYPSSPWVNAFISETGTIPVGTLSVQMLATGPFQVFVGGVNIPMYSAGANRYVGDVSGFAGGLAELRIVNTAPAGSVGHPTVVDNILFTASQGFVEAWTQTGAPSNYWSSVACSADGTRVVACAGAAGIFISTNSGATWDVMRAPPVAALTSSAEGRVVMAVDDSITWVSDDFGWNWFETFAGFKSIACSADGSRAAATVPPGIAGGGSLFVSSDYGWTWALREGPDYCVAVTCSADAGTLIVTRNDLQGGQNLWVSADFGNSWPYVLSGQWLGVASSAVGKKMFAADDARGAIYHSHDSGATWQSSPIPGKVVDCSADGTTVICANNTDTAPFGGSIFTSRDSGVTWASNAAPVLNWSSVACSADGSRLYATDAGRGVHTGGIYTLQTTPAPVLNIKRSGDSILLSWIVPSVKFGLQESADLTNWSGMGIHPALNYTNLHHELTLPLPLGPRFYRLAFAAGMTR